MTRSVRLLSVLLLSACAPQGSGNAMAPVEALEPDASSPPSVAAPVPSSTGTPPKDALAASHATMVTELRRLLVGTATLDGAPISEVRAVDACHTAFTTGKGSVTVDWTKGGNIAARDVGGREINDLPGTNGVHPLSMPVGDGADGVSGALGLLVSECS